MLLFIGRPSTVQCAAQIVVPKLFLTLIIASIFVKSERLLRVFQSKFVASRNQHLRTTAVELFIVIVLSVIQQVIIIFQFLHFGIGIRFESIPEALTLQIYCDTMTINISQTIYTSFVALICMIQAFRARKLPENYNETKFITMAMLCVFLVQLISLPLLASRQSPQAIALTEGIMICLINSLLLLILYGYKVIIILFLPEKNTSKYFQKQTAHWQQRNVERQMQNRNFLAKTEDRSATTQC